MKISWFRRIVILFLCALQFVTYSSGNSYPLTSSRQKKSTRKQIISTIRSPSKASSANMVAQGLSGGETVVAESTPTGVSTLSKIRRTVFPIYGDEVTKFLLIGSIKFFVILALTLTRDTKDTLVVTQCGAEAIAFLKVRECRVTAPLLKPLFKKKKKKAALF